VYELYRGYGSLSRVMTAGDYMSTTAEFSVILRGLCPDKFLFFFDVLLLLELIPRDLSEILSYCLAF